MNQNQNIVSAKNKVLMQKWNKRIKLVESTRGPLSLERKIALASTLENTSSKLRLLEGTQTANIGQYKRYALDIVTAVVPNLIAYDCVAVQPMDNKVGMINYISYEYGSNKGQTKAGDMFANAYGFGASDPNYSSTHVDKEMVATSDTGVSSQNLQWTPVIPGTVYFEGMTADGTEILAKDNGAGKFINVTDNSEVGTIDYASGEINVTAQGLAADSAMVTYSYDNETAPVNNVPEVNLRITSLPVVAQSRKMKALYSFDAAYELEKEYGQDIDTLIATEVSGEIAHEIDIEITNDLKKMAKAGAPITWQKTQPLGVNIVDHYDSFYTKLVEGSNMILGATRKVSANFMVCGLEVASIVSVMRNFTPSNQEPIGPYYLGQLGNFKVYVNPDYAPKEFTLGYKGSSFMDAGYFYCPYLPVVSTDLIMLDDFVGRRAWATSYGKKMVNNKMYLRGYITD